MPIGTFEGSHGGAGGAEWEGWARNQLMAAGSDLLGKFSNLQVLDYLYVHCNCARSFCHQSYCYYALILKVFMTGIGVLFMFSVHLVCPFFLNHNRGKIPLTTIQF